MIKFKVNRTYSETTPDSASAGDFSDTGFVFEDQIYTLRELIDYIKAEKFEREGKTNWLTQGWFTSCYSTGTEREECLHIELIA